MKPTNHKSKHIQQGFTLIEMLVAVALFGIILAVLVPSITALLGINRRGETQLSGATQAQQLIESVKGAWQSSGAYASNCAPGLSLPTDATLKSQTLDSRAGNPGILSDIMLNTPCPAAPVSVPPMRRIQVTTGTGTQATTLTLDVLRPE